MPAARSTSPPARLPESWAPRESARSCSRLRLPATPVPAVVAALTFTSSVSRALMTSSTVLPAPGFRAADSVRSSLTVVTRFLMSSATRWAASASKAPRILAPSVASVVATPVRRRLVPRSWQTSGPVVEGVAGHAETSPMKASSCWRSVSTQTTLASESRCRPLLTCDS